MNSADLQKSERLRKVFNLLLLGPHTTSQILRAIPEITNAPTAISELIDNGVPVCGDYAESYGFPTTFEGHKCFALGLYMFGSEAFGDKMQHYDICLSFVFDGKKHTVGLYSEKIDVSEIAKARGGGGHKGAAGFTCDELPFVET